MRLKQANQFDDARLAVRPVRESRSQADGEDAQIVESGRLSARRVVQIGATAGHAGAEVGPDRAQHDDRAAGHVLAAVRSYALDDSLSAAVPDGEAHPGPTDKVEPPSGRPVQHRVAGDRFGGGLRPKVGLRRDDDQTARQALRHVVVRLAGKAQFDTGAGEGTE